MTGLAARDVRHPPPTSEPMYDALETLFQDHRRPRRADSSRTAVDHALAPLRELVNAALHGLSPAHRHVLLEVYYRRRSVAEAAELLGVPAGTVKSRTYYALRALNLALAEQGVTSNA